MFECGGLKKMVEEEGVMDRGEEKEEERKMEKN